MIYLNDNKAKDIYIGGNKIKSAYMNGNPVYPKAEPSYIINIKYSGSGYPHEQTLPVEVFENVKGSDGTRGALVETIAAHNFERIAFYAPNVAYIGTYVCANWYSSTDLLNFARVKNVGQGFLYYARAFGGEIRFGASLKSSSKIVEPILSLLRYISKVVFDGLVLGPIPPYNDVPTLLAADRNAPSNTELTVEFKAVQTVSKLSNSSFNSRNSYNTLIHDYVNIILPAGSAAVNVANRTWAGHTFKSVTLV